MIGSRRRLGGRQSDLGRRRLVLLGGSTVSFLGLALPGGHRAQHGVRNLLVPGAGLYETNLLGGVFVTGMFVVACGLWLSWGADWIVGLVVAASTAGSMLLTPNEHDRANAALEPLRSGHAFPLVILLLGMYSWVRRLPLLGRLRHPRRPDLHGLRDLARLKPTERCQALSILALAGAVAPEMAATIEVSDVERRARHVGLVARGRRAVNALDRDHAALQTARAAINHRTVDHLEGVRSLPLGAVASEPGWVRLLDGTLTAAVLAHTGRLEHARDWQRSFSSEFALRRGHRPAAYWTPLGLSVGNAALWEHASATALARSFGLTSNSDWSLLRPQILGAAARGVTRCADERAIAAGRLWLTTVDDHEVERILSRVTVRRDPLACALDQLASARRSTDTQLERRTH